MHLKSLAIENFLSIGGAVINFDTNELILIEGKNLDSPSSRSNGAGKSTIYEALYYCLFGKTKRGLKGDDVVNNVVGNNCKVTLLFDDFMVERWRKRKGKTEDKNGLKLHKRNPAGGFDDISRGTSKETQKLLEDVIGMSELTFLKISSFGQGDVKPFASLSDRELKEVFEQALGLTFLSEYQVKIKEHIVELEVSRSDISNQFSQIGRDEEHAEAAEKLLRETSDKWKADKEAEEARIKAEIDEANKEIAKLMAIEGFSEEEIEEKRKALAAINISVGKLNDVYKKFREAYSKLNSEYGKASGETDSHRKSRTRKIAEHETVESKIDKPCTACGKIVQKADLSAVIRNIEADVATIEKTLSAASEEENRLHLKLTEMKAVERQILEKLEGLEEQKLEAAKIEADLEKIKLRDSQVESIKARINLHEKRLAEVKASKNPHRKKFDEVLLKQRELRAKFKELQGDYNNIEEQLGTAKLLGDIFSNGGLKSYLLDNVTPELNKLINEKIKMLDNIDIEVSTIKKLKDGSLREKFDIQVTNEHGAHTYKGNSGGELQKINLAIALAFNALIRKMHSSSINAVFLDEPFESLDDGSSEKVLELCESLSADGSIFLITHNPGVKELCSRTLTVTKKDGVAKVA